MIIRRPVEPGHFNGTVVIEWWNSTAGFDSLRVLPELRYMPRRSRNEWLDDDNRMRKRITPEQGERLLAAAYPILVKLGRDLMRAGVPVLLGTDASWNLPFSIPGPTVHWELHALVEGGWTPAEVLWAATAGPAEFLGRGAELGHVREGARADLLLLSGDPTSDVGALSAIDGVMNGGRWTDRVGLDAILAEIERERR